MSSDLGKYHESWIVYEDETRLLTDYEAGELYIATTNNPFWERP